MGREKTKKQTTNLIREDKVKRFLVCQRDSNSTTEILIPPTSGLQVSFQQQNQRKIFLPRLGFEIY
jgi:hypothetical protein